MTYKKPSVLMVGPSRNARGGITAVVNSYFDAGLGHLCNIKYVGTTSNGNYFSKMQAALKALFKFNELLPKYDVVHIHLGGGVSVDRKQLFMNKALKAAKPIVVHVHVNLERLFKGHGDIYKHRYRRFISHANKVIVLSDQERWFYIHQHLCAPNKIVVFHNAVEVPNVNDFDSRSNKIVFVGHMTYLKAPDVLIRSIPKIMAFAPQVHFVFAGDGDIEPYQKLAQSLGVLSQCKFMGWINRSQQERLFQKSYLYVQSSRDEAMSMSLLEAMAHGLPVVATNVGATSLIVQDGVEGFLVPSLDSNALADRIIDLIKNKNLAQRMSLSSKSQIENNFNIQSQMSNLITLYQELLKKEQN